ncbi:hypothetical protein L209DRAFT_534595 [Thermothelomyces heterothallicus CBS 203.75]
MGEDSTEGARHLGSKTSAQGLQHHQQARCIRASLPDRAVICPREQNLVGFQYASHPAFSPALRTARTTRRAFGTRRDQTGPETRVPATELVFSSPPSPFCKWSIAPSWPASSTKDNARLQHLNDELWEAKTSNYRSSQTQGRLLQHRRVRKTPPPYPLGADLLRQHVVGMFETVISLNFCFLLRPLVPIGQNPRRFLTVATNVSPYFSSPVRAQMRNANASPPCYCPGPTLTKQCQTVQCTKAVDGRIGAGEGR